MEILSHVLGKAGLSTEFFALLDGATINTDCSKSDNFKVTLAGNRTLANPTNAKDGQIITWLLKQDATGNRTVTLGAKFRTAEPIHLSNTASATDYLQAVYNLGDDKFDVINFVKAIPFYDGVDWLNVKAAPYNAKGDGVTDDRAAIQNAIDDGITAGKPVYFPAGTYLVAENDANGYCLSAPGGAILIGDGAQHSVIKSTANAIIITCPRATNDSGPYAYTGARITNLRILGSVAAGSSQIGIKCHDALYAQGHYLDDIRIDDCGGHGLYVGNSFSSHFEKIYSNNCEGFNFYVKSSSMPCITFHQCNTGLVRAASPVGFRIVEGTVVLRNCNGIYGGAGSAWWAAVGKKDGLYGETGNAPAYARFEQCNFESNTVGGVRFLYNSHGDFFGCTWAGDSSANTNYKAILYDLVVHDGQQDIFYPTLAVKGYLDDSCVFANAPESFYYSGTPIHIDVSPSNGTAVPLIQTTGRGVRIPGYSFVTTYHNSADALNTNRQLPRVDGIGPADVITASKTYNTPGIRYIVVKASAPVSIVLPWAGWFHGEGYPITIVDGLQNSGTYPITITASSGSGVGTSSSYVLSNNGGSVVLMPNTERDRYEVISEVRGSFKNYQSVIDVTQAPYYAKGDDSTDNTTAIQTALAAANTQGKALYFPKGTYRFDNLYVSDISGITIFGDGATRTILKSRVSTSALITVDAYLSTMHTFHIRDLSIQGYGSGANNHGLNFTSQGPENFNVVIERVIITDCGGNGVKINNGWFGVKLSEVHVTQPAGGSDAFDIWGSNDLTLINCYAHNAGTGKAGYRIRAGSPTLIGCNGVDSGTTVSWGVFGSSTGTGDATDAYCKPTLIGCNIEGFTEYGVRCKLGSVANFLNTQLIAPATGTVTAIRFDYVDDNNAGMFDASSGFQTQGAAWSNGYPVHSWGCPFVLLGNGEITSYYDYNQALAMTIPSIKAAIVAGSTNNAITLSRAKITSLEASGLVGDLTGANNFAGNASRVILQDGSVSRPSLANTTDNDNGIYFPNGDSLAVAVNGGQKAVFTASNHTITGNLGINTSGSASYGLLVSGASKITGSGADPVLELSHTTNPHLLVVDSANSINLRVGTLAGASDRGMVGTMTNHQLVFYQNGGEAWQVSTGKHFIPLANNSYDLGSSSFGIRDAYIGTKISLAEIAAPSTPSANTVFLYAKDTAGASRLYYKGDDGSEFQIGVSAAGGSNGDVQYNSSGTIAGATGVVYGTSPRLKITAANASSVALTVNGATAAAEDLQRWSINDVVVSSINSYGDLVLGGPATVPSPVGGYLKTPDTAGVLNTDGSDLYLIPGAGTGAGTGGRLIFQTAPAAGSGSATNSQVERYVLDSYGDHYFGGSVIGTTSNHGFVHIPSMAGKPTGTPVLSGTSKPLVIDATNKKLFTYLDSVWVDLAFGTLAWSAPTTVATGIENTGFVANGGSRVVITLAATAAVGTTVRVVGKGAGGWKIAQDASQKIYFGNISTTTGVTGYIESTHPNDCVELICITANTEWAVVSSVGNITVF